MTYPQAVKLIFTSYPSWRDAALKVVNEKCQVTRGMSEEEIRKYAGELRRANNGVNNPREAMRESIIDYLFEVKNGVYVEEFLVHGCPEEERPEPASLPMATPIREEPKQKISLPSVVEPVRREPVPEIIIETTREDPEEVEVKLPEDSKPKKPKKIPIKAQKIVAPVEEKKPEKKPGKHGWIFDR